MPAAPASIERRAAEPESAGPLPDAVLVGRALSGDESGYVDLLDRYRDRAFWTAMKYVRNSEDAADVVQEAFVKAFHTLERFDTERAFFTWLYRIVANVSIDWIRKRDLRQTAPLDDIGGLLPNEDAEDPVATAEEAELASQVQACIEKLPEPYRTTLIVTELDGLSCKELAEMEAIPHATARWRLHHARKLFRDIWERRVLKIRSHEADSSDDDLG